jgi:hypothetical protein
MLNIIVLSVFCLAAATSIGFWLGRCWIVSRYVVLRRSTHQAFLSALHERTVELDQLRSKFSELPSPLQIGAEPSGSHPPATRLRIWEADVDSRETVPPLSGPSGTSGRHGASAYGALTLSTELLEDHRETNRPNFCSASSEDRWPVVPF